MEQLFIDYLQIICCSFRRTAKEEICKQNHHTKTSIESPSNGFRERCSIVALFPQNHPHVCVRSDLREEEQGVLQLLLALLPLRLARQRSILLLVIQEAVEKVLVLEAQLLVHCVTTTQTGRRETAQIPF